MKDISYSQALPPDLNPGGSRAPNSEAPAGRAITHHEQHPTAEATATQVEKTIRKEGDKYVLYSKDGKKKLGTHGSKKAAQAQERAIYANK
jgi:hypothetical protein